VTFLESLAPFVEQAALPRCPTGARRCIDEHNLLPQSPIADQGIIHREIGRKPLTSGCWMRVLLPVWRAPVTTTGNMPGEPAVRRRRSSCRIHGLYSVVPEMSHD
jgi:hypothetical protein